jgi:glycosyltransferase involved in cell wall biosynthesis
MALVLQAGLRVPFIFDVRGLMAEEYVDAGRWRPDGAPFRITKAVERVALRKAVAIVVLTKRARDAMFGPSSSDRVHVIPCCADVEQIQANRAQRQSVRASLGLANRRVLVYIGKFTGWYMEQEMVDFFSVAHETDPALYFQVLTQDDPAPIATQFSRVGVSQDAYSISRVPPNLVGRHLAAADAAISFIRSCPSKISSSPTKIGEYLAAGLPIVTSAGIGDVDTLIDGLGTGVLLRTFDRPSYQLAAEQLWRLSADPSTANRCIDVARRHLSLEGRGIPAYDAMYRHVASTLQRA